MESHPLNYILDDMLHDVVGDVLAERFDRISLDFANTTVMTRQGRVDAFEHPDRLLEWMRRSDAPGWTELRPQGISGARRLHHEALQLRTALNLLFMATASNSPPPGPVQDSLDRVLRWASLTQLSRRDPDGRLRLVGKYRPHTEMAALAPIVIDGLRLSSEIAPARLRRCKAEDCVRWFADTSKGGQRQWCSMATCGNRAKAARYRARHGPQDDSTP